MENKNDPILRVVDVWKSYDNLQVLKGVSFELQKREVKVVFGPSGSGKGTVRGKPRVFV